MDGRDHLSLFTQHAHAICNGDERACLKQYPELISEDYIQFLYYILHLSHEKGDSETYDLAKKCLESLSYQLEFEKLSWFQKRRLKHLSQLFDSGNIEKAVKYSYKILKRMDPVRFPTVHYEILYDLMHHLTTQRQGWDMPLVGDELEDHNSRIQQAIELGKGIVENTHQYSPIQTAEIYTCIAVFLKHLQPQVEENLNEAIRYQEKALSKLDRGLESKTVRIGLSNLGNFHSILAATYDDYHYQKTLYYYDQALELCSLEDETARWFFIVETKIQFQRSFINEFTEKKFEAFDDLMKDLLSSNRLIEKLSYLALYSVPLYWEIFDRKIFTLILDSRDDNREDIAQKLLLVRDYAALSTEQGFNKSYEYAENAEQKNMEIILLKMMVSKSDEIENIIRKNKDILITKSARRYIEKYMSSIQSAITDSDASPYFNVVVKKASGLCELMNNVQGLGLDEALARWRNENSDLDLSFPDEIHAPEVLSPTNVYRRAVKKFYNALDEQQKREVVYDYRSTLLLSDCEPYFRNLELALIENRDCEAASFLMGSRWALSNYREIGFEGTHRSEKFKLANQSSSALSTVE